MSNGATRIKVITKVDDKRVGVEHIGVAHNAEELNHYLALAQERLKDPRQLELNFEKSEQTTVVKGKLRKAFSRYLYDVLSSVYDKLKFNEADDETFRRLTIARIIEPSSKLDTIRIINKLGVIAPTYRQIRWSLQRTIKKDYRRIISSKCTEFARIDKATLVLYDVTTLHFEIDKEDEYRKSGFSKNRRLEPQIIVGLLVDKNGFPLAIHSFEGNKAETTTLVPVLEQFKKDHDIKDVTVVADAGMMSAKNLEKLEEAGFSFIIGSRIQKTPYEIEIHRKENATLKDGQIFETFQKFGERWRRVIFQFSDKRAQKDLKTIDNQTKKAERLKDDYSKSRKIRFLRILKSERTVDYAAIEKAKLMAGIKGYVTNLSLDYAAQTLITAYHALFQVERSFRMAKSDLQARPIFHQKRDSIEAHLTICFAALAISRHVQEKTKLSIKRFLQTLEPIMTGIVRIEDKVGTMEPEIPPEIEKMVDFLLS